MDSTPCTSKEQSGFDDAYYDIPQLPDINVDRDFAIAKRYLQKLGEKNESLWEHLTELIQHVLANKPEGCMDYFEAMSREVRMSKFTVEADLLREMYEPPINLMKSIKMLKLYKTVELLSKSAESPYAVETVADPNMMFNVRLLSEGGMGFPRCELYDTYMALRGLAKSEPLQKVRLWGKILGIEKCYIIAECEFTPDALSAKIDEYERAKKMNEMDESSKKERVDIEEPIEVIPGEVPGEASKENASLPLPEDGEKTEEGEKKEEGEDKVVKEEKKSKLQAYVKPPVPQREEIEEIEVASEAPGEGVNRKVYFVTNTPGEPWKQLPDLSPKQIATARLIRRFFTGDLNTSIVTYPDFPGKESELLRVQIARISATTQVSPVGYFEGETEEEGSPQLQEGELYIENLDYQPLPVRELTDPSLEFWCHHTQYILKQGRTTPWVAPQKGEGGEFEGEYEGQEEEYAPRILRALSQDDPLKTGEASWTIRPASFLLKDASAVVMRSNLWPGAVTVAKGRELCYLYVGWGLKALGEGFAPPVPGPIQTEYPIGPEIMEMDDPTSQMEADVKRRAEEKLALLELARRAAMEELGEEEMSEPDLTDLD